MTIEAQDVQCTNCSLDLRPENALMIQGNPFCDRFCYQHYKMEELVQRLANLETGWRDALNESDAATSEVDSVLQALHAKIDECMAERATIQMPYVKRTDDLMRDIEDTRTQIIDEWTGEHKTMVFDAGTLKFRTTKSLKIIDEMYLFAELYDHVTIDELVKKYLKGFNLTAVKKYMGVHELPIDVAEIEYKTTVKLEVEG